MDYTFSPPRLPSLARWINLYKSYPGSSVLRALEYEQLNAMTIKGKVLDVGGGKNARYAKFLTDADTVESVNIDPEIAPTYLLEPGQPFPIEDNTFDNAVCMNTLEHIYDAKFVINETYRVLKPGGTAVITIPFLFRLHGHPDDFFRGTPSWWEESIKQAGFSKMELTPLVWGRYTTGRSITGYRGPFTRFRFHLTHLKDLIYAKLSFRGTHYDGKRGGRITGVSSGWFITATR